MTFHICRFAGRFSGSTYTVQDQHALLFKAEQHPGPFFFFFKAKHQQIIPLIKCWINWNCCVTPLRTLNRKGVACLVTNPSLLRYHRILVCFHFCASPGSKNTADTLVLLSILIFFQLFFILYHLLMGTGFNPLGADYGSSLKCPPSAKV